MKTHRLAAMTFVPVRFAWRNACAGMGDVTLRKILALGLVVLVVVGLWTGGWFWAAGEARQQLAQLAAADGETSPRLTCSEFAVSGFPFRFDLECRDGVLVDQDRTYGLKGLKASVLVYNPTHVIFSAASPLTLANAFTGSESRVDFATFEGSARVESSDLLKGLGGDGWRIARVSVVADGVAWNETVVGDLLQLSADHLEAHLLDIAEQHDTAAGTAALAGLIEAKGLVVPALKIADGDTSFEAELSGLPDDLRVLAEDPAPLQNWQKRGGLLKIVRLAGNQPAPDESFEISGSARLGPTGLMTADLTYRQKGVLDRLDGLVPPLQLAALKGKPEADGSSGNTLNMVDGQLRLLTVTLLDLGPLF